MRICFLIRQLNEGGAQRQLLELVNGMDRKAHSLTVFTFYPGGIFWDAFAAIPGLRLECLGKRGRLDLAGFGFRLIARLRDLKPDLIHGYLIGANLFAALAAPFVPRVRVIWGIRTSEAYSKSEAGYDRRLRGVERWVANLSDRIILNSHAGLSYYAKSGFPIEKMSVIPNGIDMGRFTPDPVSRLQVREELGAGTGLVIGIVGRLAPVKDHGTFLAAAAIFASRHPDSVFVVAGSGPQDYVAGLKEKARKLGIGDKVRWLGSRKDVERLYPAFDLYASTSLVEGFSNAIAEAMACGVPVVATDAGDSAHIVGPIGVIVMPGQAEGMAAAWEEMLPRLGPELSGRARQRIEREFAIARLVRDTEAIMRNLA
jgi:glycosyltransferase involved in cell wall biosynthesis